MNSKINKDVQEKEIKDNTPVHVQVEYEVVDEKTIDVEEKVIQAEKQVMRHLSAKDLQPKRKFVEKVKGFFAWLGKSSK